ncbi:hypothetical protein [Planococcus sp. ISL-109]|uniref:hypothetical protein n=1 Tax=Planococcus sp. ISL-109 TaxID=2819166 RepID=UPI001BEBF662|nr:hypothetical protein [Planococcus sp. ISL-109]MBT2582611.1 hypothetical protein [Planococcus sp. ISL-109]
MVYIKFVLLFTIAHALSYVIAGAIALKFSKDIYETKNRLCSFMNDMFDDKERGHVEKYFLPAQIIRGILMGIVLLPLVSGIGELALLVQFVFFASLMFIFTHFSSASPFMDNIEGQVYFKKEYLHRKSFWKFQLEMVMYSILFGLLMTISMYFFV